VIHVPAGPEKPIALAEVGRYLDEFAEGVLAFADHENIEYDLIHSHYWLSGLVADRLRRAWGGRLPIVHMFHTLGHMKNRIALDKSEHVPQERIDGECRVIDIADRIVVATPAEQAQLNWLYGTDLRKTVVIPPGVDLQLFHPIPREEALQKVGTPPANKVILFAGRIEPLKGIDTLLQATALIQQRRPEIMENTCVAIIGGDPWADDPDDEMARLQELREKLGISNMVTFLGSKDQDSLPNYYAAAEMVVIPSHYESFGLVALEAMACGTPVIASEVGGLAFLVRDGETGFHVPSRDPDALAERIHYLLANPHCRDWLGEQAHLYAQQYDWGVLIERMLALYEELT
jgi:D-inositol-3-phosphate glycosyltransferase